MKAKYMKNKRITPRERGLLKGAIRRVFSRSELRKSVLEAAIVPHSDPSRPRVKRWCKCAICGEPEAISNCQVDHILPIVGVHLTLVDLSWDAVINNTWCVKNNLQVCDKRCHSLKTKAENNLRRIRKK